jgi:hypothetical protein
MADNPLHLRAKLVRLSEEGALRLAAIEAAQATWADRLSASFSRAELDIARDGGSGCEASGRQ